MVKQVLMAVAVLLLSASVRAQLSPGDLHRAHAFLEGVENCTKCHGGDRELVPDKCLTCHGRIRSEQETGRGLHGRPEYQSCQNCHIEHQGRDFDLIHWKGGEERFDHTQTGFRLEGKHATLACRQCHVPKFIGRLTLAPQETIDSSRTYFGLSTSCLGCHRDEHRGQLSADCAKCHSQIAWTPAAGFDHATAVYALTGRHQLVTCAKCHRTVADRPQGPDLDFVRYTGLPHGQCSDCHADPHVGKLGLSCNSCHVTDDWKLVSAADFDHSRTRYPLEGKHTIVACVKCHVAGQERQGLKFAACRDCHRDAHNGEFAKRPSKGACEECHTVNGFTPARFLMAQHDQTDYPLRGAHQAVPCLACHRSGDGRFTFAFASTRCLSCHRDPHRGQVDRLVAAGGCETCHAVEAWSQSTFDHSRTAFPLEGKHLSMACDKCHRPLDAQSDRGQLAFLGVKTACAACHQDPHRGQFASADAGTDCARCHTASAWRIPRFDHTLSRFPLDGAHRSVPCAKCHPTVASESGPFTAYKPLETTCVACHGAAVPTRSTRP